MCERELTEAQAQAVREAMERAPDGRSGIEYAVLGARAILQSLTPPDEGVGVVGEIILSGDSLGWYWQCERGMSGPFLSEADALRDALSTLRAENAALTKERDEADRTIARLRAMTLPYPYQHVTVGDGYDATFRALAQADAEGGT